MAEGWQWFFVKQIKLALQSGQVSEAVVQDEVDTLKDRRVSLIQPLIIQPSILSDFAMKK